MHRCHLDLWEKYILNHARSEPCEGSKIQIPLDVAKEMRIRAEEVGGMAEVDQPEYRKRIFEQGHVTNLIVLYAALGKKYDKVRLDLIIRLINYAVSNIPMFLDWKGAYWIDELYLGNRATLDSMLPMIVKWKRYQYTRNDYTKFQYLIPLYTLLGDYTLVPESRKELNLCLYDIIAGTNFIGDPTWQDVFYDISKSGLMFKSIIDHADNIFSNVPVIPNKSYIDKLFRKRNETPANVLEQVGNWLAFGAYITLLSKYQRYALNAEGFRDAKGFVASEASRLFLVFREKLG